MLPWCNWRDTVALKAIVRKELRDHTPPVAPYPECSVMAARCVWDAEERFEFDILDQWSIPLAFHEYLPIILGSPKKRSSRTQQAKLHNEGSPSGKWHLALTQTACFIADRRFDPDTLNLYATVVELTYTSILGVDAERLASLSLACGTTVIEWLRTIY